MRETNREVGARKLATERTLKLLNNSFFLTSVAFIAYSRINPSLFLIHPERVASQARFFNSINHPLNASWPWITGLTAWNDEKIANGEMYFTNLFPHLFSTITRLFLSLENTATTQRILDLLIIGGCISLFSSICPILIKAKKTKDQLIIKVMVIGFLTVSPWTAYLLFRSEWYTPLFLAMLLAAMICLAKNEVVTGSTLLFISYLVYPNYAFLIAIYLLACEIFAKNKLSRKCQQAWTLPPAVKSKIKQRRLRLIWSCAGLIPFPLLYLRKQIATTLIQDYSNITIGGSSAWERIGLDANQHFAGLLGSLQFLGGYKWSVCFAKHRSLGEITTKQSILSIVNCELALLSIALISVIAIVGLVIYYSSENKRYDNQWIINIILAGFLGMLLIFQQSHAVHLDGYSFIWALACSLGLAIVLYHMFFSRTWPWQLIGCLITLSIVNTMNYGAITVTSRLLG